MSRSTTVGTPSVRIPPVGLGISTRRTARGRYRPSSSACLTLGQCTLSQPLNSATVSSSTPGAPLFWTTRRYASHKLLRSTTRSIRWSSDFVRPDVAVQTSAPKQRVADFRPAPALSASLTGASASSVRFEIIRPTLGVVVRPFGVCHLLWPRLTSECASENLSIPVAQRHALRSPRVLRTLLHAYARRIYVTAFRTRIGLCIFSPAHPAVPPLSASCSSRQRFASGFLQTPQSPGAPLPCS